MIRVIRPLGFSSLGFLALGGIVSALACTAPAASPAASGTSVDVRRSALSTDVTVSVFDTDNVPQTGSAVYAQDSDGNIVDTAEVDANGHAVISLDTGTYQFVVPGTPGFEFMSNACAVPSCTSASVTVQKPVQITVLDGWGNPLAGVDVAALDQNDNEDDFGQSDDSGQLPLSVDSGTYQFQADYGGTYFESDPCQVPGCTAATIQIQKPVQVTVTDGYGGARPDIHLAAVDTDGNEDAWDTTDDSGQATFYIPPGAYLIRAESGEGTSFDSGPSGSCPVPGCTTAFIAVTDVIVTVTASDGTPVTGQTVAAIAADGTEVDWPTTDDQGRADEFVWPGAYKFEVVVNGTAYDSGPDGHCLVTGCRAAVITVPTLLPNLALDDLGSLGGGATFANGVNSEGIVVGQSTTAAGTTHAFTWNGVGPLVDTGSAPGFPANSMATAISDTGIMTGSLPQPDQSSHVFTYSTGGGFADLGVGGDNSVVDDVFALQGAYAYGVNNSGQVAGIMTSGGAIVGFRYTAGAGFIPIGTLGGPWSWANAIAASGMVVGSSQVPGSPTDGYTRLGHAVSYTDEIGLVDLNSYVDPATGLTLIAANAVAGDFVVGGAQNTGPIVPFRLNTFTGLTEELSSPWAGDTVAYGTNEAGDTVGFGYIDPDDAQQAAFIYTDQIGFQNLNDLVDPSSGWTLEAATAIDASDDVVGWGYHNGQLSAFHLRISPQAIACQTSGSPFCLWSDGVVDQGNGSYVALFGYSNTTSSSITPTTNQVLIDGSIVANPAPAPPVQLLKGSHPGAFLASFGAGQTVTWMVNGQSVSAATSSRVSPTTAAVVPSVVGIALEGPTTKVVFDYTATTSVAIPYSQGQNNLSDETGFIPAPAQVPPTSFSPDTHPVFVATLLGSQLTWTVQGISATATPSSPQLTLTTLPDGTHDVTLPDGRELILEFPAGEPSCAEQQNCSGKGTCVADPSTGQAACSCFPGYTGSDCSGTAEPTALVGAVDGQLQVTSSGQASYSVPLKVPVGVADLEPRLSLEYRSNLHNGIMGPGWSVGGLSTITRCALSAGQNVVAKPFTGTSDDHFCWDGKLLIAVLGDYGADNTEYATEIESFSRILSHGDPGTGTSYAGPITFEVRTPEGEILRFGENAAVQFNGSVRQVWALSSIEDRAGNTIQISYNTQTCSGGQCVNVELAPSTIQYSDRQINFYYAARNDTGTHYARGMGQSLLTHLVRVAMSIGTTVQWSYRLQYTDFSGLEHLTQLSECAGDGFLSCKPATQFGYDDPPLPAAASPISIKSNENFGNGALSMESGNTVVMDWNGDGIDDLVFPRTAPYVFANGTGMDGLHPVTYNIALGTGNIAAPFQQQFDTGLLGGLNGIPENPDGACFDQNSVIDWDGDGRDDLISTCPATVGEGSPNGQQTGNAWVVLLSNPNVTNEGFPGFQAQRIDFIPFPLGAGLGRIYAVDLDGDGIKDILACQTEAGASPFASDYVLYHGLGPGKGFSSGRILPATSDHVCNVPPYFVDVDGDGVLDILRPEVNPYLDGISRCLGCTAPILVGTPIPWKAMVTIGDNPNWIDTGMTTVINDSPDDPSFALSNFSWIQTDPSFETTFAGAYLAKLMDYNGDGLLDVLQYSAALPQGQRIALWINTGNGFVQAPGGIAFGDTIDDNYAFARAQVIDWNKDGMDDLIVPTTTASLTTDPTAPVTWTLYSAVDPGSPDYQGNPFVATPLGLPSNLGAYESPVIMDVDGDGGPEILFATDSGIPSNEDTTISMMSLPGSEHLLTKVTDGLGRVDSVTYGTNNSNPGLYTRTSLPCPNTVNCPRHLNPLVAEHETSITTSAASTTPVRKTVYQYQDGHEGLFGRGWLGFGKVVTSLVDETGTTSNDLPVSVTFTAYDTATLYSTVDGTPESSPMEWYPFAGAPKTQSVVHAPYTDLNGVSTWRIDDTVASDQEVQISVHAKPYTVDATTINDTRDVQEPASDDVVTVLANPGISVSLEDQRITVDPYGNVTDGELLSKNRNGDVVESRSTLTTVSITAERFSEWLIRSPDARQVTDATDENTTTRQDTFAYYPNGLLATHTREPIVSAATMVSTYTYDGSGNVATLSRVDGTTGETRLETLSYDVRGLLNERVDAAGHVWTYVLDPARGALLRQTDPDGLGSGGAIDGFGRTTRVVTPTSVTTVRYGLPDPSWNVGKGQLAITEATAGGATQVAVYDSLGRAVQNRASGLLDAIDLQEKTYDWSERVLSETRPHLPNDSTQGVLTYAYDPLGRLTSATRPDDNVGSVTVSYQYQAADPTAAYAAVWDSYSVKNAFDVCQRSEVGATTLESTNSRGQVSTMLDAGGGLTQYRYGAFGLMSRITDALGNTTTPVFDERGRRIQFSDPDRGTETATYNAFDEPTVITDEAGTITQIHDSLGRLTQKTDQLGNTIKWSYDGAGPPGLNHLVSAVTKAPDGSTTSEIDYAYEPLGANGQGLVAEVTRTAGDRALVTGFSYDAFGRPQSVTYPAPAEGGGGVSVSYSYDDNGEIDGVSDTATGKPYWSLSQADEGYRIGTEIFGNGVQTIRTYKPLTGVPSEIATTLPSAGTTIQDLSYIYDPRGNVTNRDDLVASGNSRNFQYDLLDRLHIVGSRGPQIDDIEYDAIGNISSRDTVGQYAYTSGRPHAVTSAGSNVYHYGPRGDQTGRTGPLVQGGTQTIDYNEFGMPTVVHAADGSDLETIVYDADNQRARVNTASGNVTLRTADLYEEQRSNNQTEYRYHIFAGNREIAQVTLTASNGALGASSTKYLHVDAIGSTDAVTDDAGVGTVFVYDAFGDAQGEEAQSAGLSVGFTGQPQDTTTGLMDMKARLYDPKIGRFVSADPFVFEPYNSQELNRYSYVLNNPQTLTDPSGFQTVNPSDPTDPLTTAAAQDPSLRVEDYIKDGTVTTVSVDWSDWSNTATAANSGGAPGALNGGGRSVSGLPISQGFLMTTPVAAPAVGRLATIVAAAQRAASATELRLVGVLSVLAIPTDSPDKRPRQIYVFRSMKMGTTGQPMIGPTARTLGVRPYSIPQAIQDIVVMNGMVRPGTEGMSVALFVPQNLPQHRLPTSLGGTGPEDAVWQLSPVLLGPLLRLVPDSPTHGTIQPAFEMSIDQYQEALGATAPLWQMLKR